MARLQDLPPELIEKIAGHAVPETLNLSNQTSTTEYWSMRRGIKEALALRLITRHFASRIAEALVYEIIWDFTGCREWDGAYYYASTLSRTVDGLIQFVRDTNTGRFICTLDISFRSDEVPGCEQQIEKLLSIATNLRDLRLSSSTNTLPAQTIRAGYYSHLRLLNINMPTCIPTLRCILVEGAPLEVLRMAEGGSPEAQDGEETNMYCETLRKFTLYYKGPSSLEAIQKLVVAPAHLFVVDDSWFERTSAAVESVLHNLLEYISTHPFNLRLWSVVILGDHTRRVASKSGDTAVDQVIRSSFYRHCQEEDISVGVTNQTSGDTKWIHLTGKFVRRFGRRCGWDASPGGDAIGCTERTSPLSDILVAHQISPQELRSFLRRSK